MTFNQLRRGKAALATTFLMTAAMGLSACGKGSAKNIQIDGVKGPTVSFVDNKFTMSVVLTQVTLQGGIRVPIPKMDNSYVEVGPDLQTNGFLINVAIDVNDLTTLLKDKINTLDPLTLPGGRPLPGVSAGYLPGLALQVPNWDHMVFYVGTAVFGTFIPVKLPWQNYVGTFRFFDDAGDQIGNISIVGGDSNNQNAGILLLVNIAGKVAQMMGV